MTEFTPWAGLVGGLLIGAAATLLLWLNGRIAGVSGIVGGLLARNPGDSSWRLLFIGGLLLGGFIYQTLTSSLGVAIQQPLPLMLLAGFIVGFGTRIGSGCTSGHGVCGLGRKSVRSLTATTVFMLSAVVTVYIIRHVIGAAS